MKKILIILLLLELSVPVYAKKKLPDCELKIGAGQDVIQSSVGKPDRVTVDYEGAEVWIYENVKSLNCSSCSNFGFDGDKALLTVKFDDSGAVKSFAYNVNVSRRKK